MGLILVSIKVYIIEIGLKDESVEFTQDLCADIICENGLCVAGTCVCDSGYVEIDNVCEETCDSDPCEALI